MAANQAKELAAGARRPLIQDGSFFVLQIIVISGNMLCQSCSAVFTGEIPLYNQSRLKFPGQRLHGCLGDLEEAVALGCVACTKVQSNVYRLVAGRKEQWRGIAISWTLAADGVDGRFGWHITIHLQFCDTQREKHLMSFDIIPENDSSYLPSQLCIYNEHDTSTSSPFAWKHAIKWYHGCLHSHEKCNLQLTNTGFFPTRVLGVNANNVRLLTPTDIVLSGPYATLSHCWGNADILKLTTSNMEEFRDAINVNGLPKTFVEAIEITRRLAIPYLWIDSLCIIQDSVEDWASEANLMQHVYGHSRINISATASKSGHEGLFRDRNPRVTSLCKVATSWTDKDEKNYLIMETGLWTDQLLDAPLIRRGWVVQERILPSRALHFAHNQLLWECKELEACETYPEGLPLTMTDGTSMIKMLDPHIWHEVCQRKYTEEDRYNRNWRPTPCPEKYSGYHLWSKIVESYTGAQLSFESDKLAAIAGLAKRMADILDDSYLTGLWLRFLPSQLLWRVKNQDKTRRLSSYQAPSWSWVSVTGAVHMSLPENGAEILIDLIDYTVLPAVGHDAMSSVSAAYIKLTGRLIYARLDVEDKKYWKDYILRLRDGEIVSRGTRGMDIKPIEGLPQVFLLPVQMTIGQMEALVLERAEGQLRGWYTRVGRVSSRREVKSYPKRDWQPENEWTLRRAMMNPALTGDECYLEGDEPNSFILV